MWARAYASQCMQSIRSRMVFTREENVNDN